MKLFSFLISFISFLRKSICVSFRFFVLGRGVVEVGRVKLFRNFDLNFWFILVVKKCIYRKLGVLRGVVLVERVLEKELDIWV